MIKNIHLMYVTQASRFRNHFPTTIDGNLMNINHRGIEEAKSENEKSSLFNSPLNFLFRKSN
ncbi:hypothetical protein DERP_012949 [Dermatophagoides pteronyssinus]|uniref:Uncharacterized protein n=1 Tax=Dermatophagoides pteronyssinus TaxID=6956 RepID=A0ABQ8J3P5_DERPT|nr:hypothetical protein DERP_012949 [Dermatophagoides pteronyssinus]